MRGGDKDRFIKSESRGAVVIVLLILLFQISIFLFSIIVEKRELVAEEYNHFDTISKKAYNEITNDKLSSLVTNHNSKINKKLFKFNPNKIGKDSLILLGLSDKQAQVFINYRSKIKRFKSKEDIKKVYVISDKLYSSIESYIDITSFIVELNSVDSATLTTLPGIGPYYASKIIDYRDKIGGFFCAEQLLEIYGIDELRFSKFSKIVYADTLKIDKKRFDTITKEELERIPYLDRYTASHIWSIICSKKVVDLSLVNFLESGIISIEIYKKLIYYFH